MEFWINGTQLFCNDYKVADFTDVELARKFGKYFKINNTSNMEVL